VLFKTSWLIRLLTYLTESMDKHNYLRPKCENLQLRYYVVSATVVLSTVTPNNKVTGVVMSQPGEFTPSIN
jgi:hypothetical protein